MRGAAGDGRAARPAAGAGTLPSFCIIGAMRSGTTSLTRYLDAHPGVFMAPTKELHFFDRHHELGREWYAAHFARAGDRVAGEATPAYLYLEEVPARMATALPALKLVAVLRNPVDRAYSHYWHKRARGREPLPFAEAVAAEPGRLASGDLRDRLDFSYLDRGRYLPQLQRFCRHFPREALQVHLFEDLKESPDGVFRDLCGFLGLDAEVPANLGRPVNAYVTFRSQALRRLTKRSPAAVARILGRVNSRPGKYPPMDPRLRDRLVEQFDEDNAALAAWLGRDLGAWRA